jgi:hypothetical protein
MESEEYFDLFEVVCKVVHDHNRGKNEKDVPFYGRDSPGQWIDSLRYDHIAPIVIDYKNKTKGRHNRTLLKDAAIKIYRFSHDRRVNKVDAKADAKSQQDFWGAKDFKDLDYWKYVDATVMTTWYLMFGCGVNAQLTENVLGSLGIHEKGRRGCIDSALFRAPRYFNN